VSSNGGLQSPGSLDKRPPGSRKSFIERHLDLVTETIARLGYVGLAVTNITRTHVLVKDLQRMSYRRLETAHNVQEGIALATGDVEHTA
jgi:hypothetical protein